MAGNPVPDRLVRFSMDEETWKLPPPVLLNDEQRLYLARNFAKIQPALKEARKLKEFPNGRFRIKYKSGFPAYDAADCEWKSVSAAGIMLYWDMLLRAQLGDADGAIESCLAFLNYGRSIGDEPTFWSLSIRANEVLTTISALERCLARSEPSDPMLKDLQGALAQESHDLSLRQALRGERARAQLMYEAWSAGATGDKEMDSMYWTRFRPGQLTREQALVFRMMTRAVEMSELALAEQMSARNAESDVINANRNLGAALICQSVYHARTRYWRCQAELSCAQCALAAERFRLTHKHWPSSLDELVAVALLDSAPTDFYVNKPLRFTKLSDGIVIYSVGSDKTDDGGKLNRNENDTATHGIDFGFRLWDVSARRQPPLPPVVPKLD
ncbi:MAG: hypothetical protein HY040_25510 [Planctomycetes bacterium]|nr:hypothetical protein [Planctomycetota bacterium]